MKKTLLCSLLFALITLLTPLAGLLRLPARTPQPEADMALSVPPAGSPAAPPPVRAELPQGDLLIWDSGARELLTVPVRDYLIGALASEMPADWPEEALKAQTIASHSYALYQQAHAGPEAQVSGYFSADPARRQGFMTQDVLRSYWGTAFEENYQRLSGIVDQVLDGVLVFDGQPAAACYHAISCGSTEASQNVWNEAIPYLQGVDSPLDLTSPDYEKTVTYTVQQMYDALTLSGLGLDPDSADPDRWFGRSSRTPAGYVEQIDVLGTPLTGPQLRQMLALRSAAFEITFRDDCFSVTTQGYGHGVGLSQYGAKALAESGKSCQEILSHYYPGTVLQTG